jgi:hypothetical protein
MINLKEFKTTMTNFEYTTNKTTITINGKELSEEEVAYMQPHIDEAMAKVNEAVEKVNEASSKLGDMVNDSRKKANGKSSRKKS